ncbi:MAG: translation initiation factor IF-2 [Brevundimonas sp.]
MLTRTLLAAMAALALAGAARSQEAAAQPAPEASAAATLDEAAFEARAERFEQQVDQMTRELQAAGETGAGDQAATLASVDQILARYQPEFEGFARDFEAFFNASIAASEDAEARAELAAARDAAIPVILAIPGQIRAGIEAQFAAGTAAADVE